MALKLRLNIKEEQSDDYSEYELTKLCSNYGDGGHVIITTERSILNDLKGFNFPDEIKNQADVIYNKMYPRVRRGKIRARLLFYCVYCSHLELGRDINPNELGAIFGLNSGEVQRCDSIFSPLQTGYRPPSIIVSPLKYLPEYCYKLNLSEESVYNIILSSQKILLKDKKLLQENPQTVAAGLLKYFIETNGIMLEDQQQIIKITGRSNVTIDTIYKRIAMIDNL